jgi:tellurite methyltransferase
MRIKLFFWDRLYGESKSVWGSGADRTLIEYTRIIPKGYILDLGMGEGRNALFFARLGYPVEGIDLSRAAIKRCVRKARKANLKISAEAGSLQDMEIAAKKYSLVIISWVLNFFDKKEIKKIIAKTKKGLKKNGFVYFVVFSVDDPTYKKRKHKLKMVEKNTFYSRKRNAYLHYFTKKEALSLFKDFDTVYCAEGTELDIHHAGPHYHGFIEYLGKKRDRREEDIP